MEEREKAKFAFFVLYTPMVLFFDARVLLDILRGEFQMNFVSVGWGVYLLLSSLLMYRWRPRITRAWAFRLVLILFGILIAAALLGIAVILFFGNLIVAGAIYVAGFVFEAAVGTRLLRRAGLLPSRA